MPPGTPSRGTRTTNGEPGSSSTTTTPSRRIQGHGHLRGVGASSLSPSLPRPPSWQNSIAVAASASASNNKNLNRRRSKRSSKDERDPETADSTEDEGEENGDGSDMFAPSNNSSSIHTATTTSRRTRSRSLVATTPSANGSRAGTNDEKQNICVCVRVRPSAANAPENESPIWHLDQGSGRITLAEAHPIMEKRKTSATSESYDYHFDSLLLPPNPTQSLYNERLSDTIRGVMEGYNGTIFSYGQTGSGKTHTMMGNDEEHGIIPLAIQEIFALIRSDPKRTFLLQLSYLEIYKESLRDLLNPNTPSAKLQLVEDDKIKGKIKCTNLTWEVVTDPVQVYNIIMRGEASRSVAGTDWNERSSRSHTVISMIVESHSLADIPLESPATELPYAASSPPKKHIINIRSSQLNLIDLAGSERAVSSEDRRSEGSAINKSLLYLGNVIEKLADGKTARNGAHINYRDSKLTRLLQTSLSGNARIAIVCTISPEARHGIESVSTLKFASRAAKVVTKAERGDVADADVAKIADLSEQVARLTRELEENQRLENNIVVDDTELISERSKRQEAESQAENYRLETLRLQEEIQKLSSQMVTATSASQPIPYVPSTPRDERDYGDLHSGPGQTPGGGPTGPRGRRRISELSFIGTPISRAKQVASMRSFSSNLDIIKSPSMSAELNKADDERTKELEKEIQDLKNRLVDHEGQNKELQERIETLQQELIFVHEQTRLAVSEKDSYIQEAGKQASQIMILQRDLDQASTKLSTSESALGAEVAQLQAEISTLRFQIAESESQLTIYKESQTTSKAEEVQKLMDATRELEEVQAEMEEVKRMSANKDQALSSQRKQLENFKLELEDAVQTQKDLEAAEQRLEQLKDEIQERERSKVEEIAKLKETHTQELKIQMQKNEAAILKQESLQEELKTLHGLLSSKDQQGQDSQSELQQLREALRQRDETIATQKRGLEQKDATIAGHEQELQTSAHTSNSARAQASSLQIQLEQATSETTSLRQKAAATSQQSEKRFARLEQDSADRINRMEAALHDLQDINRTQADSITRMQAELDKHELARARQQAIKASKAPPDYSSLRAKLQAVSHSSGIITPLSRSTSSNASSDQDEEGKVVKMVEALRKEPAEANSALEAARSTIAGENDQIKILEREIERLNRKVEELGEHLTKYYGLIQVQAKALRELGPDDSASSEIQEEVAQLELEQAVRPLAILPPSPRKEAASPVATVRPPFANLGHRASNSTSSYRASSRPSTPSKREMNNRLGTPEPLPTPPGMWDARKPRRTTIDNELENLRLSQRAERSKTILLSPKAERTKEWKGEHGRSRTLSSVNELEKYRYKKSSS